MAATIKEGVLHAFEITKEEEIAAPMDFVFENILEYNEAVVCHARKTHADGARSMARRTLVSRFE